MFLVIIPLRQHPIPFRTRKLSSYGPMVLAPQGAGRVGHRQILYISRYIIKCVSAFFYFIKKTDTFYSDRIFWTTLLCFKILCTTSLMYTSFISCFILTQNFKVSTDRHIQVAKATRKRKPPLEWKNLNTFLVYYLSNLQVVEFVRL